MMIGIIISYQQDRKDGKYDGYDVIDCMNFSPSCQSKILVLFTYIIYISKFLMLPISIMTQGEGSE